MNARPIFRVVLSSTFVDLEDKRREVIDLMGRHDFHEVVMDNDAAKPIDKRTSSLQMVDAADAYIGIIGYRYGARVQPENVSLTELEWRRAKERDIPRCFLVMSPEYKLPRKYMDAVSAEDSESLETFRKVVQEEVVVAVFDDDTQFSVKAMQSLEYLRRTLDRREQPRMPAQEASGYKWRPLDFDVYMADKRDSFTGRDWLFKNIEQWRASEAGSRALLIKADYGVGKSALMSAYVHRHQGQTVLAYHFCRHDMPETLSPGSFVRSLAAQLAQALPAYRQSVEGSQESQKQLEGADARPRHCAREGRAHSPSQAGQARSPRRLAGRGTATPDRRLG